MMPTPNTPNQAPNPSNPSPSDTPVEFPRQPAEPGRTDPRAVPTRPGSTNPTTPDPARPSTLPPGGQTPRETIPTGEEA